MVTDTEKIKISGCFYLYEGSYQHTDGGGHQTKASKGDVVGGYKFIITGNGRKGKGDNPPKIKGGGVWFHPSPSCSCQDFSLGQWLLCSVTGSSFKMNITTKTYSFKGDLISEDTGWMGSSSVPPSVCPKAFPFFQGIRPSIRQVWLHGGELPQQFYVSGANHLQLQPTGLRPGGAAGPEVTPDPDPRFVPRDTEKVTTETKVDKDESISPQLVQMDLLFISMDTWMEAPTTEQSYVNHSYAWG